MADILIGNVRGPQGETGATGSQGPQGDAATITVGTVSTTAYGNTAQVINSGTEQDAVLDFVIPQGKPGEQTTRMGALTLDTITAQSADFPIPAVGETGSTVFGKIIKFFNSTISALNSKLNISDVVNNLTSTSTTQPLSAAQGKALNDASVIMRGVLASSTTLDDLLTLAPGVYKINYNFAWMPTGAFYYGTLVSYVSGSGYGVIKYTDTTGKTWLRHHTTDNWHNNDWIAEVIDYHTWLYNVNLNDYKMTQVVWLASGISNAPESTMVWGPCLILGQAGAPSDTVRQIVFRDTGMHYRVCKSGTWDAWKTVTMS